MPSLNFLYFLTLDTISQSINRFALHPCATGQYRLVLYTAIVLFYATVLRSCVLSLESRRGKMLGRRLK